MSEQLKQELEADTDRLETGTVAGSETIGEQEEKPTEGKLEAKKGGESKEEIEKPVKQKAREKLEVEKKKATQKNFADPVITYLMKRCEEDQGLAEDVMQEGKTWSKCFNYIVEQARKQSNGRSTAVEDRVVYEWAEDYFRLDDKALEEKKKKERKELEDKRKAEAAKRKSASGKQKKKAAAKKDNEDKKAAAPDKKGKTPKNKEPEGQMSLFDLL